MPLYFNFVRMHYIKYIFTLVILCAIIVYIKKYEISFNNVDEFKHLLSDFKYDIVLLNSKNKFEFDPTIANNSSPLVIITNTAGALYEYTSSEDGYAKSDYIKSDNKNIVNWTSGWKEVTGGKCNKYTCANIVKNSILSGNYLKVSGRLLPVKKTNPEYDGYNPAPGFIVSNKIQDAKFRMFERDHAKIDNYTSVVTMEGARENVLLFTATVVSNKNDLEKCLKNVFSLFIQSNRTHNNWYPFSKLRIVGAISVSTFVKFTDSMETVYKPPGYNIKLMDTGKNDKYYRYDIVALEDGADMSLVSRISGMNDAVQVRLFNVTASPVIHTNDDVSIMQNDDNTFNAGDDEDDSIAGMNTESEFEDKIITPNASDIPAVKSENDNKDSLSNVNMTPIDATNVLNNVI